MKKLASTFAAAALGVVLGIACGGSNKATTDTTMPQNTGGEMTNPCGGDAYGDMGNPCGGMGGDMYGGDAYGGDMYGGDAYGGDR